MLRALLFSRGTLSSSAQTGGDEGLKLELLAGRRCGANTGAHSSTNKNWSQQWPANNRTNSKAHPRTHAATSYRSLTPGIPAGREHEEKRE
jgi:hypothetical protein